jgi:drug/metabolite transporter (DMT)-like permease
MVWFGAEGACVPVYNVLKRMAPLPTMAADRCLRGQRFPRRVQFSVFVIVAGAPPLLPLQPPQRFRHRRRKGFGVWSNGVAGALVTGAGDLDFDATGYGLALLSCLLQAGYLVYASKAYDAGLCLATGERSAFIVAQNDFSYFTYSPFVYCTASFQALVVPQSPHFVLHFFLKLPGKGVVGIFVMYSHFTSKTRPCR